MAGLLLSNPSLSSPLLTGKRSITANSKSPSTVRVSSFRSPRCTGDSRYEGPLRLVMWVGFSASFHGFVSTKGNTATFPRINVRDPYRRLGVSRDAGEQEIWSSRNFLLAQYAPHERSAESIESAFEKLLTDSFIRTKKRKINLKTMLKKQVQESPPWFKNLLGFVEVPPTVIILRRLFLFAFIAGWSIMNSAETGPAFQVAISLAACIYFLNVKKKSLAKASMIGLGLLVAGWICGSFLVPAIPAALLHPSWTLELLTSLVAYVFLFLGCTFLK